MKGQVGIYSSSRISRRKVQLLRRASIAYSTIYYYILLLVFVLLWTDQKPTGTALFGTSLYQRTTIWHKMFVFYQKKVQYGVFVYIQSWNPHTNNVHTNFELSSNSILLSMIVLVVLVPNSASCLYYDYRWVRWFVVVVVVVLHFFCDMWEMRYIWMFPYWYGLSGLLS